jgi:cytochrome c biogenesis protein CcdA
VRTLPTVLLYGLVAAASPLALASTLMVLRSGRGRLNGSAFLIGFVLGQAVTCLVAVAIGALVTPEHRKGHDTIAAVLALALGALLLAAAWRLRSEPPREARAAGSPRTKALLERLARLRPTTAFGVGTLLGIGGPKRLTITLLTAATISLAGIDTVERLVLVALYVVVASLPVWLPVVVYLLAGRRADAWIDRVEAWLTANQRPIAFGSTLVVGVLLVGDAFVQLL